MRISLRVDESNPVWRSLDGLCDTDKEAERLSSVAMSFAALATVLFHIAMYGAAREADEGTAAHIWQLLMVGQVPIVAFFAIKWLPQTLRQALPVLVLQVCAVLAALAPVWVFDL